MKLALGDAGPPASLQCAGALLQALRQTYPDGAGRWFALVPEQAPVRARDTSRESGLDVSDLRVLYRALRVTWLAELVFGGREQARQWLCSPKRRLLGRVPLLLCQHGRHAAAIEEWLVNIDEGNGP
ncbi:MbcA/ParS/Xre antitoxin family protein [Achromobacter sp. UMC46]|uniref:MbcA/ParS/Xre antitoxin family protein n=1 Tax=Achromobacter sp. UMC46 TaxID=1862319 RepID=UPI0021029075|nr:MbcA/ParS/Xre antitoxin family protein [Achromobacter sp. UMC46]